MVSESCQNGSSKAEGLDVPHGSWLVPSTSERDHSVVQDHKADPSAVETIQDLDSGIPRGILLCSNVDKQLGHAIVGTLTCALPSCSGDKRPAGGVKYIRVYCRLQIVERCC
jgi:hypothetical protein